MNKRTSKLVLRLTDDELKDIREKAEAAGITVSELLRQSVRRTRTWTIADKTSLRENTRAIAYLSSILANLSRNIRLNPRSEKHLSELDSAIARLDTLFQKKGGENANEDI